MQHYTSLLLETAGIKCTARQIETESETSKALSINEPPRSKDAETAISIDVVVTNIASPSNNGLVMDMWIGEVELPVTPCFNSPELVRMSQLSAMSFFLQIRG